MFGFVGVLLNGICAGGPVAFPPILRNKRQTKEVWKALGQAAQEGERYFWMDPMEGVPVFVVSEKSPCAP